MPSEARTVTEVPETVKGSREHLEDAARDVLSLDGAVDSLDSSANSSPPSRAAVSGRRRQPRMRAATSTSSASPARVPERVVDALEVVDVEEDHRDTCGAFRATSQRLVDLLPEERAVGEVRQGVVIRLVRQLLLELGQPRDRPLHPAVLEDCCGSCGEGAEEAQVASIEAARVEMTSHHEAADHSQLAAQQRDHRLVDVAPAEHLRARIPWLSATNDDAGGLGFEHVIELPSPSATMTSSGLP